MPSEYESDRRFMNQSVFDYANNSNGLSNDTTFDSDIKTTGFSDPKDMKVIEQMKMQKKMEDDSGGSKEQSAGDFIYIAFFSQKGVKLRINLKITGPLKPIYEHMANRFVKQSGYSKPTVSQQLCKFTFASKYDEQEYYNKVVTQL